MEKWVFGGFFDPPPGGLRPDPPEGSLAVPPLTPGNLQTRGFYLFISTRDYHTEYV